MRFLCDVHISLRLSKRLEQLGHHSEHVNHILNKWHTADPDIVEYVDANDCILITKDQDFRTSYLLNNAPKKLLKINLGNISNQELIDNVESNIDKISELDSVNSSFMVEVNKGDYWIVTR
ncbi:MAG: DUF5615 family PIN-like protein [Cyclobacteriaceae bacterium]